MSRLGRPPDTRCELHETWTNLSIFGLFRSDPERSCMDGVSDIEIDCIALISVNEYRICGNILSSSLSHMNLEGMHWLKSVICRELSMRHTQVMSRASDDQRMAYRSIALRMTWHRQTSHPGLMRNWRLGFILIYELMMKLCSSGKPLMNLGKLGMFGGPCLVENRWSSLTMCSLCLWWM